MSKLIKASILAGFLAHIWITVSWMALPLHKATVHKFNDDPQIQLALLKGVNTAKAGIYAVPEMHGGKHKPGPSAFIALTPKGQSFSWTKIAVDLVQRILSAFFLGLLMLWAGLSEFKTKVKFSLLAGVFAISLSIIPNIVWWGFAIDYAAVEAIDLLMVSLISGLVLAKFTEN